MDPQKLQDAVTPQPQSSLSDGGHRLGVWDLITLSVRTFRVRPMRTLLTIMGMAFGIGAVLFLVSLGSGLQFILIGRLASTEDSLVTLDAYYPPESGFVFSQNDLERIGKISGAGELSPIAERQGEVSIGEQSGYVLIRIAPSNYSRLAGVKPELGRWYEENETGAVITSGVLRLFNITSTPASVRDLLPIGIRIYEEQTNGVDVSVVNVSGTIPIQGMIVDDEQAPTLFFPPTLLPSLPPSYQRLLVKATDLDTVEPLRDTLLSEGLLISARIDIVNQARRIMNIITVVLGVFGTTALVVSAIGMFNTMIIGFLERIYEVGIMKSIGATAADIRNLFLMESVLIGFLGGVGGIAIGVGMGEIVNLALNFLARYLGGKPLDLFIYPVQFMAFIMVLSILVGLLAGFWPARRAAKLSPRMAFKER